MTNPTSRRRVVLTWVLVPAIAFIGLLTWATLEKGGVPRPGDPAPDFEAPLLTGDGSLALADLRGKPVFINFWASWCGPCRDEAPMIERALGRYGNQITFLGVDIRDARSDAIAFVQEYGLDFDHVRDENLRIYDDYGLTGQPESFFIDSAGVIVEHVNGPMTEEVLNSLLAALVQDA